MLRAGRISPAYRKPHTCRQHRAALTGGMTSSAPARTATRRVRIRRPVSPACSSLVAAIAAVGLQLPASSPSSPPPAGPPVDVRRPPAPRGAPRAGDGAVPDGTTVFDDDVPGVANLDPALLAPCAGPRRRRRDGVEFVVNSGWRSPAYQEQLLREAVSPVRLAAEARPLGGHARRTSAHVSGDAVDIGPAEPRRGCPSTAPRTGCARSTATSPGTTSCARRRRASGCPRDVRRPDARSEDAAVMTRRLRPPAALALRRPDRRHRRAAVQTHRPRPAPAAASSDRHASGQGGEVRRVHARARRHGRSRTRTPRASSTIDGMRTVVDRPDARCGRRPSTRARTCSRRGSRGGKRSPSSSRRPSSSPSASATTASRTSRTPSAVSRSIDTNNIPSANEAGWHDHPQRRDADSARTRRWQAGLAGPVRRGRGCCRRRPLLVVARPPAAWSRCPARRRPTPAAEAAGEHRDGGEGRALGHGLPGRDPDLPSASGRLAVLRGQPGPRHLHRRCPRSATRSAAAACSTAWTTGRCCCCAARSRPTATCTWATRGQRRPPAQPATCTCSAYAPTSTSSPTTTAFTATTRRRSKRSSTTGALDATGALALGDAVFLPDAVRIAKVTGKLGGAARPGAPVAQATSDTLEVQVDLDAVPAGRGQAGRPRPDHAAGQHDGDGEGGPASGGSPQAPAGQGGRRRRRDHPGLHQPRRPGRRRAGSTGPRSRWTSRPRGWTTP